MANERRMQQQQQQQQHYPGMDMEIAGKAYIDDPVWGRWVRAAALAGVPASHAPLSLPFHTHVCSHTLHPCFPPATHRLLTLPLQVQPGPPGTQPRWYTHLCLGCCPCCVPPCCSTHRKAGCWRVAKSASFALSLIQIAVLIAALSIRGFAPLAYNQGLGPWGDTLDWMGAKNAYKIFNGDITNYLTAPTPLQRTFSGPQPWRLFTSIFLHSGLVHIALNLLLQMRLALHAEVLWGKWRFLPIYFACGINGALWSSVVNPFQISVGASGALLGIMGAWFVFLLCHWGHGDERDQVSAVPLCAAAGGSPASSTPTSHSRTAHTHSPPPPPACCCHSHHRPCAARLCS